MNRARMVAHSDDPDHLFRLMPTGVARVRVAPLGVDGERYGSQLILKYDHIRASGI
ncbi:hypothetical protein BH10PSE6_BH10PSE6_02510 [soil metagenome]